MIQSSPTTQTEAAPNPALEDILPNPDHQELRRIVGYLREFQLERQLTDTAMCRKFSGLGSTKTYSRIYQGKDLGDLDIERWLSDYRAVWSMIESGVTDPGEVDELYTDLQPVILLKRAVLNVMRTTGLNRFVLVEGDTGCGKTKSRQAIEEEFKSRCLMVEAQEVWNDSPRAMLEDFLIAFGTKHMPVRTKELQTKVIELLCLTRTCILLDEGHHLGHHTLNVIKTLINRTPGEFIVFAMPTLWKRLEGAAYEEARQLTGNRLNCRVKLTEVAGGDVKKLLERIVKITDTKLIAQATQMITPHAKTKGNLAFVKGVCIRAKRLSDGDPVTLQTIATAVNQEVESR